MISYLIIATLMTILATSAKDGELYKEHSGIDYMLFGVSNNVGPEVLSVFLLSSIKHKDFFNMKY
jgi:hypothetical protein